MSTTQIFYCDRCGDATKGPLEFTAATIIPKHWTLHRIYESGFSFGQGGLLDTLETDSHLCPVCSKLYKDFMKVEEAPVDLDAPDAIEHKSDI